MSSSLYPAMPGGSGIAWPPAAPYPLPPQAMGIVLTVRPDWPGEPPADASVATLAEHVVAGLAQVPEIPLGLRASPPVPEEPWQREGHPESLLPATGGFVLSDLIWFG